MKPNFHFYIDIVGACNLRCPSCAVGNTQDIKNPQGIMSPETLEQILEKATHECIVNAVSLLNWTEPLLHPKLPEMIRVVKKYGLKCCLSSNLNKIKRMEEMLAENPFSLRISLSGFKQESYGVTHRGGDIEVVKANMRRLSELKLKTKSGTHIEVAFLRYLSNLEDELQMKQFSEQLGFKFTPMWALLTPLEKVLAKADEKGYGSILDADKFVIDNLALPLGEALEAARGLNNSCCELQEKVIALDIMGRVQLCCGVYDGNRFSLANFLEKSIDEIQALRFAHSTCVVCMKHGVHDYFAYKTPGMDMLAKKNIVQFMQNN